MAAPTSDVARYQRYQQVLEALLREREFSLSEIREACAAERPAFVTRVVRQLHQDGYLEPVNGAASAAYRWCRERDDFSGSHWLDTKIYGVRLSRTPVTERPRERLLAHGPAALRTAELLAILVRSGRPGESALQAGEKIANRYADSLENLSAAGRGELGAVSAAVQTTAYCQIMAGVELGRRVAEAATEARERITHRLRSTEQAFAFCADHFDRLRDDGRQEELHVVTLNTQYEVISVHRVTVGLLDASVVHPREVFRPALQDAAKAILLVHNHPSGDPTPSRKDVEVTERLEEAARTLSIPLLDHIIVARDGMTSLREFQQGE